jgi:peptide/nickel transport system permease protein/oligopeptide transport system permease protein
MFLLHYMTSVGIQLTGNPVRALFGDRTPSASQLTALSKLFHLDDPCLKQKFNPCGTLFVERMQGIFLHFDFGTNLRRQSVIDIVSDKFPYTVKLALLAFVIEVVLGIAAGVLAGLRGGSFWDNLVKVSTVLVISIPVFVLGVGVRTFVGVKFGNVLRSQDWIPEAITRGVFSSGYKADYPWASLIIPAAVLAALSLAVTARLTRTSLMENIRADYVRTAKAKGLRTRRVVGVHTLRNSLIPVVTFLGVDFGTLLGGAVITETIFNIPGIGRLVTQSARSGDASVIVGVVTILVLIFLVVNLLVDLLYAVLDPRIRYE